MMRIVLRLGGGRVVRVMMRQTSDSCSSSAKRLPKRHHARVLQQRHWARFPALTTWRALLGWLFRSITLVAVVLPDVVHVAAHMTSALHTVLTNAAVQAWLVVVIVRRAHQLGFAHGKLPRSAWCGERRRRNDVRQVARYRKSGMLSMRSPGAVMMWLQWVWYVSWAWAVLICRRLQVGRRRNRHRHRGDLPQRLGGYRLLHVWRPSCCVWRHVLRLMLRCVRGWAWLWLLLWLLLWLI